MDFLRTSPAATDITAFSPALRMQIAGMVEQTEGNAAFRMCSISRRQPRLSCKHQGKDGGGTSSKLHHAPTTTALACKKTHTSLTSNLRCHCQNTFPTVEALSRGAGTWPQPWVQASPFSLDRADPPRSPPLTCLLPVRPRTDNAIYLGAAQHQSLASVKGLQQRPDGVLSRARRLQPGISLPDRSELKLSLKE